MDTQIPVPHPVVPETVSPAPVRGNKTLIIIGVVVLVLALVGAWFFLKGEKAAEANPVFRIVENGTTVWYEILPGNTTSSISAPEGISSPADTLLTEGDFSAVMTESGAVMTLSPQGLFSIGSNGVRTALIERNNIDYGSSALSYDGGAAALYNAVTNQIDVFSLDNVRPAVLSFEGSVLAPPALYGVALLPGKRLIVRTGETTFELYTFGNGSVAHSASLTTSPADNPSAFFRTQVAYAWTWLSPKPVATNAVTTSDQRCTGTLVASLGQSSGSGAMPSPTATTIWGYMPIPGNLPASYNNGTYCIQAKTTVYVSPTATLTASPASITTGGSSTLTWSSTNATSCTGTNFSTGNATSGSVVVAPSSTITYSISCTGTGGTGGASATVTVSTGGGGGGGGCFSADTLVSMADGSVKPISEVALGDRVLSEDEEGNRVVGVVTQLFVHEGAYDTLLVNGSLVVTPNHSMRVVRDGHYEWIRAGQMREGDVMVGLDNLVEVTSIERSATLPAVYNLEVESSHTYFAGGMLVHNILKN